MAVQLSSLAFFNAHAAGHYLLASTAALELTLLHNFVWHIFYTWRDHSGCPSLLQKLLRFQLSNGLVSMLGNLLLMRLLVRHLHAPVIIANAIAILCCSVANFWLGHTWAFRRQTSSARCSHALRRFFMVWRML